MYHQLIEEGYKIGIDRTLKYMCIMGLEALYPEVTPMSQTKNDSKRETLFVNY